MITTPFVSMTESNGYNANCPDGYIHFNNTGLRDLIQQWLDGAPNYGWAIRAGNETSSTSWKRFHSADYGGTRVPKLTITYAVVPDAPAITGVSPEANGAKVTFSAPANNGGSAITGYTVTPYFNGTTGTPVAVASSPATIGASATAPVTPSGCRPRTSPEPGATPTTAAPSSPARSPGRRPR